MHFVVLNLDISKQGVADICFNRPDIHNAFDEGLINELTYALETLENDPNVRFVVLRGKGKSFCSGADLNWMKAMKSYSEEENIADSSRMATMFARLRHFPKPTIAVVQGAALGGGAGLVAACDYVLATEDAKFGFTEVRLGLIPSVISPYVIEKIGMSAARAYFTSGMLFSAQRAREIGLVHQLVAVEGLEQATKDVIAQFMKAGPIACQKAKALIDEIVDSSHHEESCIQHTVEAIARLRVAKEAQDGMGALLNKKKPTWASE